MQESHDLDRKGKQLAKHPTNRKAHASPVMTAYAHTLPTFASQRTQAEGYHRPGKQQIGS